MQARGTPQRRQGGHPRAPARATCWCIAAVAVLAGATAGSATAAQACRGAARPAALSTAPGERPAGSHAGAILLGTSAALAVYGKQQWWGDGFDGRFKAVNEGWFGASTYSGGADKLGHFYMSYASTRLLTCALVADGGGHARSLRIAAWYALGAFAAIEVLDGFSRQWTFSREDMLMNAAGVGAAVLLERHPGIDRVLDLRLLYRPSREPGQDFDPFGDYSGQTYLVVARLAGFAPLRRHELLRYVELSAGYGTRGFDAGRGRRGTRNLYAGLSLNLSELLNHTSRAGQGRARRLADTMLEYVPGTAVLLRRSLDALPAAASAPQGGAAALTAATERLAPAPSAGRSGP